ncbi:MAG: MEMO1 family protein [Candidatus Nitrosocaldaceae archaeon]
MQVRKPAVAGMFYPADRESLLSLLKDSFLHTFGPRRLPPLKEGNKFIAMVVPHAGYIYSGSIAAHAYYYASALKPELIILVGPNHYAIGSAVASARDTVFETPLGSIEVDNDSLDQCIKISGIIDIDLYAHTKEHSLEVQLPMLQFIYTHKFKILPIILWMQDKYTAIDVGNAIAEVSKGKNVLLIASSDFTHYEPNEIAYKKDKELINTILELDINHFYTVLERYNVTACGYGAIASIIHASLILNASNVKLLKYATSGDITNNKDSVVGYASMIIS